ncbi:uncharacterized protein LOC116205961 isoform X1 [Punica granatum]|uniref:Uncharacterized protein LOC116205961 isoform X1 n=3 Tax=Punica granatum TaxID=22663 RepID=A0A6P8DBE8_PUNGR|nr:uncharacterized protein LOC116205961 isoform X1 [Punica granatum]XP_031394533.1 uncharacterized protein LOC116205961 isoform X1 [Punica granatum]
MASASSSYAYLSAPLPLPFPSPKPHPALFPLSTHLRGFLKQRRSSISLCLRRHHAPPHLPPDPPDDNPLNPLALSAVFFSLALGFASSSLVSRRSVALASDSPPVAVLQRELDQPEEPLRNNRGDEIGRTDNYYRNEEKGEKVEEGEEAEEEDRELKEAFEKWKSKSFALTVPLRVVALRGSVPPSWVKEFMQSQGKRSSLQFKMRENLEGIFSDMSAAFTKGSVKSLSTASADLVTVGDSWLSFAIKQGLIEPINGAEDQDWFKILSNKWKVYLRRNSEGDIDPDGKIWAAPYRWGTMVIAYKKSKFKELHLDPIEDWADLWRPELSGRIAMVNCPREVVGAVLKHMGASYNTKNIDSEVVGGKDVVEQNMAMLAEQVRLFDSSNYLKAFGVGDVWVAVGWSSDVLPAVKRLRNVAMVVPKSGSSLWADLWAIPAASRLNTTKIGGRVRGPSPLIHQWIEFCMQTARALPFTHSVIPGALPSSVEGTAVQATQDFTGGKKPKLDTNLISGVPPPEILARCEFLEPLPEASLADYNWLILNLKRPNQGLIQNLQRIILRAKQTLHLKRQEKVSSQ